MIPVAIAHPVITPSANLLGTSIRQSKTIAITMQITIVIKTNFLLIVIYIIIGKHLEVSQECYTIHNGFLFQPSIILLH